MRKLLSLAVVALVAVAACGSDGDESSTDTTVTTADSAVIAADVTARFDGDQCTIEGPAELDPGQHTFLFINEADRSAEMWLQQLVDGVTFDDAVEYMEEQGGRGVYPTKPEWMVWVPQFAPETQPVDGQRLYSHDLPADGLFISFGITDRAPAGTTDKAIWMCGPIQT